jgi:MinD-like ATPase involved in chromosome partitioning or flagellar assembly/Flp pilus assembly protein TadD
MQTITFYSYKGGVGRSLTLVNIATRLAEFGKKVCVIDFDLEAPGLHYKFNSVKVNQKNELGIVDFIYDFSNKGILQDSIKEYCTEIHLANSLKTLTLINAGNTESKNYWKKLSAINWYDLIYENKNGLAFFLHLKEIIQKEIKPDFLLIDSRTGISEMSGISLSVLADEVVVVAANNKENLIGAKKIITTITNPENSILEKTPYVTFVLSRIPFTNKPEDRAKEIQLINRIKREYLSPIVSEINVIHSDRDLEENERIKIAYDEDEQNSQISRDYLKLFEKLTKDCLSEDEKIQFKNIKNSEKLFLQAQNANSLNHKLEYINKAIALNSNNIDFSFYKAKIFYWLKDYRSAIELLNSILKQNQNHIESLELIADIYLKQKETEKAKKYIDRKLKITPNDINTLIQKSLVYYLNEQFDEAEKIYSDLILDYPDISIGYGGKGNILRIKKDFTTAIKFVYKALELDSENIQALTTLAEIYAETDRIDDFYINFENALKIDSNYIEENIYDEEIYSKFLGEERFVNLLNKYDIYL